MALDLKLDTQTPIVQIYKMYANSAMKEPEMSWLIKIVEPVVVTILGSTHTTQIMDMVRPNSQELH